MDALGRAQSLHLWLTLIGGLFLFALQNSASAASDVEVPVIGLKLSVRAVLAVGGPALALIIAATVGSMTAWGDAGKKYAGESWAADADRLDMHPTTFDLAFYAARAGDTVLERSLFLLFYPTFLALALAESAVLVSRLWATGEGYGLVLLVVGAALWTWAASLVLGMWWKRLKQLWVQRFDLHPTETLVTATSTTDRKAKRIKRLTASRLVRLGQSDDGRTTLFRDPRDRRLWELSDSAGDDQVVADSRLAFIPRENAINTYGARAG